MKKFLLKSKRYLRVSKPIIIRKADGTYEKKRVVFETMVASKNRKTTGKTKAAQYLTSDERVIEGLLASPDYGKTFYMKGDEEGKLKKTNYDIADDGIKKAAIRPLFEKMGLEFDNNLPFEALKLQLEVGSNLGNGGAPTPMSEKVVNPKQEIEEGKAKARDMYEEKYGEPVPEIVSDDVTFLSGMTNPDFDAQKYIAEKEAEEDTKVEAENEARVLEEEKEELRTAYFDKFQKNVPPNMKNNVEWIKGKLAE